MRVHIYEEDTTTLHVPQPCDLAEVFGGDTDSPDYREAHAELQRIGRYWLGGGSAPLYFLQVAH